MIECDRCGEKLEKYGLNQGERIAELEAKCQRLESRGIEDMKDRIAELEAQQQWARVSERQPDSCEFIAFDGDDIFTASLFPEEEVSDRYEGVTHWMPLPEPPKESSSD